MKAALAPAYGDPARVVVIREVPPPEPVEDQVLVRVQVASVNRADLDGVLPRWAFIRLFFGLRRPRNPRLGLDAAGVVEAVGPAARAFRPGDRVYADLFPHGAGAFAEYVCARERAFRSIPDGMTFEHAATLPHSAVLAIQGLRLRNGRVVGPTDRVLIVGASGNVGPFAVQIAKARGARVTGVASGSKADLVRSLGADEVIDYRSTDVATAGERYDWILDVDSRHPILRWRHALRPGGVYVTLGGPATGILDALLVAPVLSRAIGRRMGMLMPWKPFAADDMAELERLVLSGEVRPVLDRTFPLDEVGAALRYVADGHARGKVLVLP